MAHIIRDSCDATLQVGAASLGKKVRCPKCKATFTARENEVIDDFDEVEEDEDERPAEKSQSQPGLDQHLARVVSSGLPS